MPVKDKIKRISELFNHKGKRLDDMGREIPSDIPMEPPLGYVQAPSLMEQIQQMVRGERLRAEAEAAGFETFEESDDFDIPDDPLEPLTAYEANFEGGSVRELMQRQAEDEARQRVAQDDFDEEVPKSRSPSPKSPKAAPRPSEGEKSGEAGHVGESE